MQLNTLHLRGYKLDTATAQVICQLPMLKILNIKLLIDGHFPSSKALATIFTTGHTATNLYKFVVYDCRASECRLVERRLGLCIPCMDVDTYKWSAACNYWKVEIGIVHACPYEVNMMYPSKRWPSNGGCLLCPRCCALASSMGEASRSIPLHLRSETSRLARFAGSICSEIKDFCEHMIQLPCVRMNRVYH